jgi:hypothetical protein
MPILIALDDLFVPRDVMPVATLSRPIIIKVISIKKRRVKSPSLGDKKIIVDNNMQTIPTIT